MAKKIKKKAFVRCRGGSQLLDGIERATLPKDCKAIIETYPNGIHECVYGCLGGGSCVSACRLGAIIIDESGAPVINEKCVGCGLCARVCPQDLIDIIDSKLNIQTKCKNKNSGKLARETCGNSCISCGICEKNCPADAIHVVENIPVIDPSKCICCGMCAVKCPRGVIRDSYGIMTD